MALLRRSSLQKGQACTGPEKFVRPTADSITGFIEIAYTLVIIGQLTHPNLLQQSY